MLESEGGTRRILLTNKETLKQRQRQAEERNKVVSKLKCHFQLSSYSNLKAVPELISFFSRRV